MKSKLKDLLLILSCIAGAIGEFMVALFFFFLMLAVAAYVAVGIFKMMIK